MTLHHYYPWLEPRSPGVQSFLGLSSHFKRCPYAVVVATFARHCIRILLINLFVFDDYAL